MAKKKERPPLTPEQIINYIRIRCDEVGDCWLWKGALTGGCTPNMRKPGQRNGYAVSTRAIALEAMGKMKPSLKHWASNTCNEPRCTCPDHAVWLTRSKKMQSVAKTGVWSTLELSRKKAAIHQATSPLDWDKVRDIRSRAPEVTDKALAAEFGVDAKTIRKARNHQSWIEYQANPFAGLFAANDSGRKRA